MPSSNPRYRNYSRRVNARLRLKAMGMPCWICGKPIDYSLDWWTDPKDNKRKRHPLSFEVDELVPISKGGSPTDMDNLRPAHRICNQRRGNRMPNESHDDCSMFTGKHRSNRPKCIEWSSDW